MKAFTEITVELSRPGESEREAVLDIITYTPLEEVIYLRAADDPAFTKNTRSRFPNLRALSFYRTTLSAAFPKPDLTWDEGVFPSLEHVSLNDVDSDDGSWRPLVAFLARRASSGNRLDTLVVTHSSHMCEYAVKEIRGTVRELKVDRPYPEYFSCDYMG